MNATDYRQMAIETLDGFKGERELERVCLLLQGIQDFGDYGRRPVLEKLHADIEALFILTQR